MIDLLRRPEHGMILLLYFAPVSIKGLFDVQKSCRPVRR